MTVYSHAHSLKVILFEIFLDIEVAPKKLAILLLYVIQIFQEPQIIEIKGDLLEILVSLFIVSNFVEDDSNPVVGLRRHSQEGILIDIKLMVVDDLQEII